MKIVNSFAISEIINSAKTINSIRWSSKRAKQEQVSIASTPERLFSNLLTTPYVNQWSKLLF